MRRNKHKRRINGDNTEDTAVNAGFRGSKPGQRKKPFKRNTPGPSSLDRILDRLCQIHGTPDKPANHTNRDCWVFKQAGKLNAENKDKRLHSDDEEEPRPPNIGGQKKFPVGTPILSHTDLACNTSYHFAASRTVFPQVPPYLAWDRLRLLAQVYDSVAIIHIIENLGRHG